MPPNSYLIYECPACDHAIVVTPAGVASGTPTISCIDCAESMLYTAPAASDRSDIDADAHSHGDL